MLVSIWSHNDKVKLIFWSELTQKSSQETRRLIKNDILGRRNLEEKYFSKFLTRQSDTKIVVHRLRQDKPSKYFRKRAVSGWPTCCSSLAMKVHS